MSDSLANPLHYPVLNVLFARAFTHHLPPGSPLIVTCVNPGFCVSEIRRNLVGGHRLFTSLLEAVVGRTAEQGSRQILWAALGPDASQGELAKDMQGAYVSASMVKEPSDFVISDEGKVAEERIWVSVYVSLSLVWIIDPWVSVDRDNRDIGEDNTCSSYHRRRVFHHANLTNSCDSLGPSWFICLYCILDVHIISRV